MPPDQAPYVVHPDPEVLADSPEPGVLGYLAWAGIASAADAEAEAG